LAIIIIMASLLTTGYTYRLGIYKQFADFNKFNTAYTKGRDLGKGSFGNVFFATDNITNAKVIVKRIKVQDSDSYIIIINEIDILIKLKKAGCKYTTCFKEYCFDDKYIYLIFEDDNFNNKESDLYNFIDTKPKLTNKDLDTIFTNLIDGLDFIHSNNIAHTDIKPENIIINTDTKDIKYIDFGVSCNSTICGGGGTRDYMSPAYHKKFDDPSAMFFKYSLVIQSDVWALGLVLDKILKAIPSSERTIFSIFGGKNNQTEDDKYSKYKKITTFILNNNANIPSITKVKEKWTEINN